VITCRQLSIFLCAFTLLILGCSKSPTKNEVPAPTVTDIDGNVYHLDTIGTQVWMVENLKTTRLNDGTAIELYNGNTRLMYLGGPAYCWYNNDIAFRGNAYGALYNWLAASNPKLAPKGWHVPTDAEWNALITYLGGGAVAGAKLSETGNTHWTSATGATNESGFTALPAGYIGTFVDYEGLGIRSFWWTSTDGDDITKGWTYYLDGGNSPVHRTEYAKFAGFSIRCVRGEPSAIIIPRRPPEITVTKGDGQVTVTWDTVTYNAAARATSYNLYYKAGILVDKVSGTEVVNVYSGCTINGLTNDSTYAFAVSAVNSVGESGLSPVQTATPARP
jgi:uncharacterized protein (TIGR02145 family)